LSICLNQSHSLTGSENDSFYEGQPGLLEHAMAEPTEQPGCESGALRRGRRGIRLPLSHREAQCIGKGSQVLSLSKAGNAHRQELIDDFKFGPGQLRSTGRQWQVISVEPFRSNDRPYVKSQEILNPKSSDRNGNIDFDWKAPDKRVDKQNAFDTRTRRGRQGGFSLHLRQAGCGWHRRELGLGRHMAGIGAIEKPEVAEIS
jgi:hypothetical protein